MLFGVHKANYPFCFTPVGQVAINLRAQAHQGTASKTGNTAKRRFREDIRAEVQFIGAVPAFQCQPQFPKSFHDEPAGFATVPGFTAPVFQLAYLLILCAADMFQFPHNHQKTGQFPAPFSKIVHLTITPGRIFPCTVSTIRSGVSQGIIPFHR